MSYVPLIDSSDEGYSSRVIDIMKTFNVPLDSASMDLTDLLDVQSIMKEGKIQDLAKCIQNVLNYNLNASINNSIRVLDPSFVTLFHVAQFIIKFLLFWKTNLFNENVKLQTQFQEVEKLRKDYLLKKLEARDLRKQLSLNSRSKNVASSECSQCRKVFVNDTYLYAHHKRRHGDQPFVSNRNDILLLQNEIQSMKQQLLDAHENSPSKLMKMKLVPEMGCLQSQEKYWKGRIKELHDTFEDEKKRLIKMIDNLETENSRWNRKLNSETRSVQTQTDSSNGIKYPKNLIPVEVELSSSSTLLNGDFVRDSSRSESMYNISSPIFSPRWSLDAHSRPEPSPPPKDRDIIDQVDSFLENYNRRKEVEAKEKRVDCEFLSTSLKDGRREEVRKVISKLFSTDESSEELTEKLVRIYDRRGSLVNESSFELNSNDEVLPSKSVMKKYTEDDTFNELPSEPSVEERPHESDPAATPRTQPKTPAPFVETIVTVTKPKSKFFPFFRNIPTKLMKNYAKSRKVNAEVVEDEVITRSGHQAEVEQNGNEVSSPSKPIELKNDSESGGKIPERSVEFESKNKPPEVKLVSALKKSKSTGNLAKKVMFVDDLPTIRTNSESDLSRSKEDPNIVVGTVDVHYDKFALPIPAPRARKNIVSVADAGQ